MKITHGIFIGVIIILFTLLIIRIVSPDSFNRDRGQGIFNSDRSQENNLNTKAIPKRNDGEDDTEKVSIAPGTYKDSIQHNGLEREYLIHFPQGYTVDNDYPVVFLLHGGMGSGSQILDSTKLAENADRNGYIVVAPDGVDNNWNDGRERSVTGNRLSDIDDVDFIETLIDDLSKIYAIDKNRIYSTGISNGGSMTQKLACDTTDTFAAIAPLASPMQGVFAESCTANPIPVLGIQGSEDPFHPIYDNDGIPTLPRILERQGIEQSPLEVEEITEFWTAVNRCTEEPEISNLPQNVNDGTQAVEYAFRECLSGKPVMYYIVYGMGHSWPGNQDAAGLSNISGPGSKNLNANQVIWDFFSQNSL